VIPVTVHIDTERSCKKTLYRRYMYHVSFSYGTEVTATYLSPKCDDSVSLVD